MLARILGGLAGAAVGFILVWKSRWFEGNFGSISSWADEHLGGTNMVFKLIGILIIFISFLVVTNLHVVFFESVFGGVFGGPPTEPQY
jgi:hypothetical protein